MKIILQSDTDLVGQAKAAEYALSLGRPEGKLAFRIIAVGTDEYSILWNKKSVSVYSHKVYTPKKENS